ncbi:MAG TPA: chemotaxis protein CheB [Pirellulaceae bacterium]|jgi:two-component system chemotaxis response regulator CheB|nr:chemotaxis protein CheB [Pirellulaceae bacterium]
MDGVLHTDGDRGSQFSSSSPKVVVIAASAGGLQALRPLLAKLPAGFPAAIALVIHRGTDAPERLVELLSRWTPLRVRQADSGAALEAGTIYVCPPGVHMVAERSLRLVEGPKVNFVRPCADLMMESAAAVYGDHAIGVVLSGAGRDGAVGGLAISQAGGAVIAQDAASCAFDNMPSNAIKVGAVDRWLAPEEIALALQDLVEGRVPALPLDRPKGALEVCDVLLVDDHQILLDGLRVLVDAEPDMKVVAVAGDGESALLRAVELAPRVVVMDVCMPGVDGIEATRRIAERSPDSRVIALSSRSDARAVQDVLNAGAIGYLTKTRASDELVRAIRTVVTGRTFFSRDVAALVASGRVALPLR